MRQGRAYDEGLFERGYFELGRIGGVRVRLHWTAPLGAFVFGRLAIVPGFWLGFLGLIGLHELGHAAMVRASGARVIATEVHGLGGQCRWTGEVSSLQRALIAWGGVFAQAVVLLAAMGAKALLGPPTSAFTWQLYVACTDTNIWLMLLNLMPIPPLDGAEAWRIVGILFPGKARHDPTRWITRRHGRGKARAAASKTAKSMQEHDARGEISPEAAPLVADLMAAARKKDGA